MNEPLPEFSTFFAVHVIQDDPRPIVIHRYENAAHAWAEQAFRGLNVKYEVRPIKLPTALFLAPAVTGPPQAI